MNFDVSDFHQTVFVRSDFRAHHPRDFLGTETDAQQRFFRGQDGVFQPVELGSNAGVVIVVCALRAAEHHDRGVVTDVTGQLVTQARAITIEREALVDDELAHLAGR